MKLGPLTFQWACFICVCRSMASASLAFNSSTSLMRVCSARSIFVVYIGPSFFCGEPCLHFYACRERRLSNGYPREPRLPCARGCLLCPHAKDGLLLARCYCDRH